MIFKMFLRNPNEALIARLHGEIMAQARHPAFFIDYGVADTPEGRFEMVALHVLMAVRRLNDLASPGPELAQDLTDAMFQHLEIAFRELGVSDTAVPKRMKKHASAWLGRARAYGAALDADDREGLAKALARNVYGAPDEISEQAWRLSRYVFALGQKCAGAELNAFLAGPPPSVDPAMVV